MLGNLPELPNNYVAIPIPQREQENTEPRLPAFAGVFSKFRTWCGKRRNLTPAQKLRRRELFQSLFLGVTINLVLILALLFVTIDPLELGESSFFTLVVEETQPEEKENDSAGGSAGGTVSSAQAGAAGAAEFSGVSPAAITTTALTPMSLEFSSTDLSAPSLNLGQSITQSDFAAIESEKRRKMREFVYGNGSHHAGGLAGGVGIGEGTLQSLFPKADHGDGSGIAVIVDMSGSMQQISMSVESYIKQVFPRGITSHVNGCALNGPDDAFLKALATLTKRDTREDFYFVCDLQDGETVGGIKRIRSYLLSGNLPKRLHVISFDKAPEFHLSQLIRMTEGSFTYIDPTLEAEEK